MKRNRVLSAALAASVLVLVGGVGTGLVQLRQARVNPVSAPIERARRADDLGDWAHAAANCATGGVHEGTTAALGEFALPRQ